MNVSLENWSLGTGDPPWTEEIVPEVTARAIVQPIEEEKFHICGMGIR
jgi:hypothetical protein